MGHIIYIYIYIYVYMNIYIYIPWVPKYIKWVSCLWGVCHRINIPYNAVVGYHSIKGIYIYILGVWHGP